MLIAKAWFRNIFLLRSSSATTKSWFLIKAVETWCRRFLLDGSIPYEHAVFITKQLIIIFMEVPYE